MERKRSLRSLMSDVLLMVLALPPLLPETTADIVLMSSQLWRRRRRAARTLREPPTGGTCTARWRGGSGKEPNVGLVIRRSHGAAP